jgi:hypothetical protein
MLHCTPYGYATGHSYHVAVSSGFTVSIKAKFVESEIIKFEIWFEMANLEICCKTVRYDEIRFFCVSKLEIFFFENQNKSKVSKFKMMI